MPGQSSLPQLYFDTFSFHMSYISDVIVGFEESNYTVSESENDVEVCMQVFNDPERLLVFQIILTYFSIRVTAGK